jgi:hypothetical protein
LDTFPPSPDADAAPFTLTEKRAPSPVRPFPAFVLPPPPRTFNQSASNQRPPPGMGLASYVVTQQEPHHPCHLTRHFSLCLASGTTSAFLGSQQAHANCAVFLFPKAVVRTT